MEGTHEEVEASEELPESGSLTDEALVEIADALFVELDKAENEIRDETR